MSNETDTTIVGTGAGTGDGDRTGAPHSTETGVVTDGHEPGRGHGAS